MGAPIQVMAQQDLEAGPATSGMQRMQAFAADDLWVGEAHTEPGATSGWHHHGDYITYGYVVAGRIHFDFGPDGADGREAGPGEFFLVPPHTVHRERNPDTVEQVIVLVRSGAGPTVTNVDGPDPD